MIIVRTSPDTIGSAWFESPEEIGDAVLVFSGDRPSIITLPPPIQSNAAELLVDGYQSEEALLRLAVAMSRNKR